MKLHFYISPKHLLTALLIFFTAFLGAQVIATAQSSNLVVNPGFESDTFPVIETWPIQNPPGTAVVNGWFTPTPATPDYYNSNLSVCDGFPIAIARTGTGRCAIICGMKYQLPGVKNYKEYVEGKLASPLVAGKKYDVSFYVALDCSSAITATGIGAYFSPDRITAGSKERLPYTPQVITHQVIVYENGWTKISGSFTARGNEQYITIGSFSDTASIDLFSLGEKPKTIFSSPHISMNAYFYLDDVCVAPSDAKGCNCTSNPQTVSAEKDYFLFLLDVSNSMNQSGKLKLMKKQICRFADSLDPESKIGIMTFSDYPGTILPFCSPSDKKQIDFAVSSLRAQGGTNGDLALKKVLLKMDSLHLHGKCHIIMATDGIFQLSAKTKSMTDSCLVRNNISFCVLQFGDKKNNDLEEIAQVVPGSFYTLADKKNLPSLLHAQLKHDAEKVAAYPDVTIVYYTDISKINGGEFMRMLLLSNPQDGFGDIPRK